MRVERITISLPPGYRDRLLATAAEEDRPVSRIIARALRRYFADQEEESAPTFGAES